MKWRSTPPLTNWSRDRDRATDATSGNSDRARMNRTVGQMNSQRAAPSERSAPSEVIARRGSRVRGDWPSMASSPGSVVSVLPLDAKAGDVGSELLVLSGLIGDRVPAVLDGVLGAGRIELLGKVLRDGGVEDVLLVALGQRDPHVQNHVLVLEARLDGPEVVLGRGLAEARV